MWLLKSFHQSCWLCWGRSQGLILPPSPKRCLQNLIPSRLPSFLPPQQPLLPQDEGPPALPARWPLTSGLSTPTAACVPQASHPALWPCQGQAALSPSQLLTLPAQAGGAPWLHHKLRRLPLPGQQLPAAHSVHSSGASDPPFPVSLTQGGRAGETRVMPGPPFWLSAQHTGWQEPLGVRVGVRVRVSTGWRGGRS